MKYLPIYQSHLKARCKFSYSSFYMNNSKYLFVKYATFVNGVTNGYDESTFQNIFIKYMNHDIKIIWNI